MKRTNALYNALVGIGGLMACAILLVSATALLLSPRQQIALQDLKTKNIQACTTAMKSSGFEVIREGNSLQAKMPGLKDYKNKLLQGSLAISACDNLKLVSYCMGTCKDPSDPKGGSVNGTFLRMSYLDPVLQ
ncbi:hypothetical protein DV532_25270 (plasmid) [Pseudomonas sp. Leaf58]|uniref:hypothetical protein n=1 Tax=unclassified Pseudomonas TaxID=196821 RepID=UPI000702108E|nr:hypothetical protein [Pseudomonas sp. Leaf58]AYG47612.1 hypothetical protein DV532_25270 [Pseudomonas sp. Leaf58]KQN61946.1 hypothetical protein ASF02_07095 [Pseudomonas sp. Leaf58]